jgi:hypothetical protein
MDKTTIQLKKETKETLDKLKRADGESYDSVVKLLIANYDESQSERLDESDVETIVDRKIDQLKRELR